MEPADAVKQLQAVSDQLKATLARTIRTQDGEPVAGYKDQLGKVVEDLEKAKANLAKSLVPPLAPPDLPKAADLTDAKAALMERAEQAKKRAAEIEAARTRGPLDGPPIPFQGDHGLDPKKIQGLISSLLHGMEVKSERQAVLPADLGSVNEAVFEENEKSSTHAKPEVADDWPEELRAPSYKKQTAPDKNVEKKQPPKPRPQPFSDDQSIGKGWDDDDL